MVEISFIYKINDEVIINYGKIKLPYISDDEHSGLDILIRPDVWNCLSCVLFLDENKRLYKLDIGVIGALVNNYHTNHFTCEKSEINIFKLYICEYRDTTYYYYNGKNITDKVSFSNVSNKSLNIYESDKSDKSDLSDNLYISSDEEDESICIS
jgi:hypothetical protein